MHSFFTLKTTTTLWRSYIEAWAYISLAVNNTYTPVMVRAPYVERHVCLRRLSDEWR